MALILNCDKCGTKIRPSFTPVFKGDLTLGECCAVLGVNLCDPLPKTEDFINIATAFLVKEGYTRYPKEIKATTYWIKCIEELLTTTSPLKHWLPVVDGCYKSTSPWIVLFFEYLDSQKYAIIYYDRIAGTAIKVWSGGTLDSLKSELKTRGAI